MSTTDTAPASQSAPPSSGRVLAALADRVDEALAIRVDDPGAAVPGVLSHAAALASLVAAVKPLLVALRRRTSEPLASIAPLDVQVAVNRDSAIAAALVALRACHLGAHGAWLTDELDRLTRHLDDRGAHGDYARYYIDVHLTKVRKQLRVALIGASAEERSALLAARHAIGQLWAHLAC